MRAQDASARSVRPVAAKSTTPKAHRDSPNRKLQRGALQDRVAAALRRALMIGQFVPGQTMSLRQLAQGFGTSPMPVREAINQLTAAGALEILPNRSLAVPRMTEAQFVELTRIRTALEGMAAEMACKRAPPQLAKRLERINAELHKAIQRRDNLASLAKNQEFHFTLYTASGSTLLPRLIEALWLRAGPFMYFSLASPAAPWDASSHADAIAALRAGNAAATRAAIERDINGTAKFLLKKSAVFGNGFGQLGLLSQRLDLAAES